MKKSNPTPKELARRRIYRSKIMKIPINEGNFDNKENMNPSINIKKTTYKTHDRDVKDGVRNPFDIPQNMRCFSSRQPPRKSKPEPFIMSEPNTICDLDETFYKIIEGRPLRQFTDVKVYMKNIRDITLNKANAAYLKDQLIQIDMKIIVEREKYNKINKLYQNSVSSFVQFAKQSYNDSRIIQMEAEEKALELANVTEQLEAYSFEYIRLRNQLSNISFNYDTLTIYAKFIYSISPLQWKKNKINFTFLTDGDGSNLKSTSMTSMDEYKAKIYNYKGKPSMYFKRPSQLMSIFEHLERQCLNYMQIDVFMKNILNSVQKQRDALKAEVKLAVDEMEEFVDAFEKKLIFYEEKADDYKKVFDKILMSKFKDLFASYDSSKLFTCVQYVNTRVFGGPEDPKDSIVTLMAHLETFYVELSSGLDNLDQGIVKVAVNEIFSEDIKTMNRAHVAQRTIRECDILKKALFSSVEPSRKKRLK